VKLRDSLVRFFYVKICHVGRILSFIQSRFKTISVLLKKQVTVDSDAHMIGKLRKSGGSYNSLIRAGAVDEAVQQFASPTFESRRSSFNPSPGGLAPSSG
jgi:hypothetical protein